MILSRPGKLVRMVVSRIHHKVVSLIPRAASRILRVARRILRVASLILRAVSLIHRVVSLIHRVVSSSLLMAIILVVDSLVRLMVRFPVRFLLILRRQASDPRRAFGAVSSFSSLSLPHSQVVREGRSSGMWFFSSSCWDSSSVCFNYRSYPTLCLLCYWFRRLRYSAVVSTTSEKADI